ncbi:hypothetical protein Moror_5822 [Moniliophthora roreri MCA 2997]|uniref:Uncharacterized protein n=1 Tax=Moniliophthora roreri (strain MCA 2997) TaxID=1381753 RepID=V2Y6E1_MONRO|nr:hypothetical protein Moror_5822 [Moniliophthora roreri MCA 2997]
MSLYLSWLPQDSLAVHDVNANPESHKDMKIKIEHRVTGGREPITCISFLRHDRHVPESKHTPLPSLFLPAPETTPKTGIHI